MTAQPIWPAWGSSVLQAAQATDPADARAWLETAVANGLPQERGAELWAEWQAMRAAEVVVIGEAQ